MIEKTILREKEKEMSVVMMIEGINRSGCGLRENAVFCTAYCTKRSLGENQRKTWHNGLATQDYPTRQARLLIKKIFSRHVRLDFKNYPAMQARLQCFRSVCETFPKRKDVPGTTGAISKLPDRSGSFVN